MDNEAENTRTSRSPRSFRPVLAVAGVLVGGLVLADPAAAHGSAELAAAGYTDLTAGRLGAMTAAGSGLIGVVIGTLAVVRPEGRFGTDNGRRLGATAASMTGLVAVVLGGFVAVTADGGLGTGNGLGGAVVALVVGLVAVVLGGLALARSRRSTARGS